MFEVYDLIVALDGNHRWVLRQLAPGAAAVAKIRLLGSFDPAAGAGWDVPDPVGGDRGDYERAFRLIESALPGLVAAIAAHDGAAPPGSRPAGPTVDDECLPKSGAHHMSSQVAGAR